MDLSWYHRICPLSAEVWLMLNPCHPFLHITTSAPYSTLALAVRTGDPQDHWAIQLLVDGKDLRHPLVPTAVRRTSSACQDKNP